MLKRRILKPVLAVVTVASAIGLFNLSSAPAHASALPAYRLIVNSGFTALYVMADGPGNPVILSSQTATNWVFVNSQRWTAPDGVVVEVSEMQHAGTDECINNAGGVFYMDGCVAGDANELFYGYGTGSTTHGSPNEWYLNAAESNAAHQDMYLTATSLANGAKLVSDPAGFGGLAAWNRVCTADC
jgi:hypothetical protein